MRPEVAEGASEEALSLPQQLSKSDQVAVPQHQTALVAIQERMEVCGGVIENCRRWQLKMQPHVSLLLKYKFTAAWWCYRLSQCVAIAKTNVPCP